MTRSMLAIRYLGSIRRCITLPALDIFWGSDNSTVGLSSQMQAPRCQASSVPCYRATSMSSQASLQPTLVWRPEPPSQGLNSLRPAFVSRLSHSCLAFVLRDVGGKLIMLVGRPGSRFPAQIIPISEKIGLKRIHPRSTVVTEF